MLQIIILVIIVLFSASATAQQYQGGNNVPAFLRQEAAQQAAQPVSNAPANEPAFLRREREEQMQQQQQLQQIQTQQNQYQYQSADPNSTAYPMPPGTYQPAPGNVPAFMQQPAQTQSDDMQLKTNKKEDVIEINFSDDQYKTQDEVTTLNPDQATQYNTEVQSGAPTETQEPPPISAPVNTGFTFQSQEQNKPADKKEAAVPEPEKATKNLLRITYNKEDTDIAEKDKKSLLDAVVLLKQDKSQKILIKSYTSNRDSGADTRRIGLIRVVNIRDYLMKQGIDFSRTDVKLIEPDLNKENLDYIDIDKI